MNINSFDCFPPNNLIGLCLSRFAGRAQLPAVITEEGALTYGQLERHTATIAAELFEAGVRRGDVVPIVLGRGWQQVAAAFGILRTGAAYLPLDPLWPEQRRAMLLQEVGARVVLTQSTGCEVWPAGIRQVDVELLRPEDEIAIIPMPVLDPEDLAYVIYTSGSTGRPKGVMINHVSAANTIIDINDRFAVSAADRVLSLSSLSFDLSVYDMVGLLAAGGAVVMPPHSVLPDPARWLQLVTSRGVTIWNSVPALMELLVRHMEAGGLTAFGTLRLVLLSGDWIPISLPGRIRKLFGDVEVVSLGGATEASIWSIHHRIETVDRRLPSIPYGRALSAQSVYVMDEKLETVLDEAPGDLYIGGLGVARGYWADPAKTAVAFIPDPISGGRMYRTGDCGRNLPNGEIEFLGRKDQQVKIRGYRIELGEVEATLEKHPNIQRAVAIKHSFAEHDQRILAFVTPRRGSELSERVLQEFLAKRLPNYMIPSAFISLETFPMCQNGKIDRKALALIATVDHGSLDRLLDQIEQECASAVVEAAVEDRLP